MCFLGAVVMFLVCFSLFSVFLGLFGEVLIYYRYFKRGLVSGYTVLVFMEFLLFSLSSLMFLLSSIAVDSVLAKFFVVFGIILFRLGLVVAFFVF